MARCNIFLRKQQILHDLQWRWSKERLKNILPYPTSNNERRHAREANIRRAKPNRKLAKKEVRIRSKEEKRCGGMIILIIQCFQSFLSFASAVDLLFLLVLASLYTLLLLSSQNLGILSFFSITFVSHKLN